MADTSQTVMNARPAHNSTAPTATPSKADPVTLTSGSMSPRRVFRRMCVQAFRNGDGAVERITLCPACPFRPVPRDRPERFRT